MRDSVVGTTLRLRHLVLVAAATGLLLAACGGGGEQQRRDPTWRPSERHASLASHWWWTPVETPCEEDQDCEQGQTCSSVRLGTCENCPRGETARVCTGGEELTPEQRRQRASANAPR